MCDYCQKEQIIYEKKILDPWVIQWIDSDVVSKKYLEDKDTFGLFIDRGYLRFVDLDDSQCLDHGFKIKINFCPFCGDGL